MWDVTESQELHPALHFFMLILLVLDQPMTASNDFHYSSLLINLMITITKG